MRGAGRGGAAAARVVQADGFVARVRPWPGEPTTAQLVTVDQSHPPTPEAFEVWFAELAASGFTTVRTGALGPTARPAYLEVGFHACQELALLQHPLDRRVTVPKPGIGVDLRRPRADDLMSLAMVDRRAFGERWSMDVTGIVDACGATPVHRLRVAARGPDVVGYAITGRAGRASYLQRLAVLPSVQRSGTGRALTLDALVWARRHRCTSMLVNTHVDNEPALALYRSVGFSELAYRLVVLERSLA